jgi:hypothetical protein
MANYAMLWIFKDLVIALLTWSALKYWQSGSIAGGIPALIFIFVLQELILLFGNAVDAAGDLLHAVPDQSKFIKIGLALTLSWAQIWLGGRLCLSNPLFSSRKCRLGDAWQVPLESFAATRGYGTILGILPLLVGLPVLILHMQTVRWADESESTLAGTFALIVDSSFEFVLTLLSVGVMAGAWARLKSGTNAGTEAGISSVIAPTIDPPSGHSACLPPIAEGQ